ncbi:hypothetical protein [Kribbella sp. CA-294648]|uniref:hypothetical protein n=1 Tax=Kribbella sp. CA-294648 TaxID=3239948 RepID=UPI003D8E7910
MNEQDLRDRLELTVATDLGEQPFDPAADLRRGRSRLRRHRIATGFATVTSVAAVAALGLQFMPASSTGRQGPAPAAQPTVAPPPAPGGEDRAQQTARLASTTMKKLDIVAHRHIDPDRKYTKQTISESFSPTVFDSSNKLFGVGIGKRWQQNGDFGQLQVEVFAGTHSLSEGAWCRDGGMPELPGSANLTCTTRTAPNGRRIVTAKAAPTASPAVPWNGALMVRYVRPDGQVVTVSVWGVIKPSVTLQQLIEAAIDPEMSLPK